MARERDSGQDEITDETTRMGRRDWLKTTGVGLGVAVSGLSLSTSSVTASSDGGPVDPENWELAFEDRFEDGALDSNSWGVGFGWGTTANNDDATVIEDDVYIENGELVLEINHHGNGEFTQGAVNTGSPDAVDYPETRASEGVQIEPGMYIEARMKPATRNGVLPGFWSKPDNEAWPPEIDFAEVFHYGDASDSQAVHAELHYSESGQCNDESTSTKAGMGSYDAGHDLSEEWHVYGCEWHEDEIRFYFDGELYDSTDDPSILDAFNNPDCLPHYVMFTNHVNRLGTADESTTWTDETRVDWCRVWEYAPGSRTPDEETEDEQEEDADEEEPPADETEEEGEATGGSEEETDDGGDEDEGAEEADDIDDENSEADRENRRGPGNAPKRVRVRRWNVPEWVTQSG